MPYVFIFVVFIILGYLIGSISFARIVGQHFGLDITKAGSGNPGATNISRTLGKRAGALVFFGDFVKSFIVVWYALNIGDMPDDLRTNLAIVSMLSTIIGHNFPIFFKFRGGKGISVTMGGLAMLMPSTLIIGILIWYVIFHATRFVSLASLFFAASLPVAAFAFGYPQSDVIFSMFICGMIFWRHRENIRRLYNGSEYRFVKKS
ncbi:MAG: glycerol-3-phosphate 1-O-acyltransferase PlsY [Opitutales bacterium]|nr:glycerol-3-phosphate 1-O-acyltransferase PlsY [Opitutales bacterium]